MTRDIHRGTGRVAVLTVAMTVMCFAQACAEDIVLSARPLKNPVLPYEPMYFQYTLTNVSDNPVEFYLDWNRVRVIMVASSQKVTLRRAGLVGYIDYGGKRTLQPKASVSKVAVWQYTYKYTGNPDSDPEQGMYVPVAGEPGTIDFVVSLDESEPHLETRMTVDVVDATGADAEMLGLIKSEPIRRNLAKPIHRNLAELMGRSYGGGGGPFLSAGEVADLDLICNTHPGSIYTFYVRNIVADTLFNRFVSPSYYEDIPPNRDRQEVIVDAMRCYLKVAETEHPVITGEAYRHLAQLVRSDESLGPVDRNELAIEYKTRALKYALTAAEKQALEKDIAENTKNLERLKAGVK